MISFQGFIYIYIYIYFLNMQTKYFFNTTEVKFVVNFCESLKKASVKQRKSIGMTQKDLQ